MADPVCTSKWLHTRKKNELRKQEHFGFSLHICQCSQHAMDEFWKEKPVTVTVMAVAATTSAWHIYNLQILCSDEMCKHLRSLPLWTTPLKTFLQLHQRQHHRILTSVRISGCHSHFKSTTHTYWHFHRTIFCKHRLTLHPILWAGNLFKLWRLTFCWF